MDKVVAEQIALGVFEGALNEEHLEDVVTCATIDAPNMVKEIEQGVNDFKLKTMKGAIAGIDEIAKAFNDMSAGLKTCGNAKNIDQVERLVAMVETFKNPETLALHLGHDILFNGVDIEKRINKAVTDFNAQNWLEFGRGLGNMLSEISIGTETQALGEEVDMDKVKVEQISLGLFEGILDEEHLEDIVTCATVDVPHAVGEIETAVQDME